MAMFGKLPLSVQGSRLQEAELQQKTPLTVHLDSK